MVRYNFESSLNEVSAYFIGFFHLIFARIRITINLSKIKLIFLNNNDEVICVMRKLFLCLLIYPVILFYVPEANAQDSSGPRFRLSGFGTLDVTSAGKKQFGYHNEFSHAGQFGGISIFSGSVAGLQLDADLLPKLSVTVQGVVKERTKQDLFNFLDWAFFRYQLTPSTVIRAGRMGIDLFMLSEYRNVGFAYLWAHPIIEFYMPISLSHFDGFDLKYSRRIDPGFFEFKIYGGQTGSDVTVSRGDIGFRERPFFGVNASLETDHWKFRLTYATAEVHSVRNQPFHQLLNALNHVPASLWPQAAAISDHISAEGKQSSFYSAGIAYDKNAWVIQSEFAWLDSKWPSINMTNGYLSAGRRIGPVTLYSVGAYAKSLDNSLHFDSNSANPDWLTRLQTGTQNALNATLIDQNSFSLGVRWDLNPQTALKAQWDHTWVRKHGGGLLILKEPLDKNITLDAFSVNLNFIFK